MSLVLDIHTELLRDIKSVTYKHFTNLYTTHTHTHKCYWGVGAVGGLLGDSNM